jgi:ribosomal protein S18 acetylase RimI-like enzyme
VEADDIATRARQRELVRRGYDAISWAYRGDDGEPADASGEDTSRYAGWVGELAALLPLRARVADLGCGAGIPVALYHYRGQQPPPIVRRLLMSAPWQAFGSVRAAGQTIAVGRVAVAGEWAGLTAVEVHPDHRRRGLATAITAVLAAAAAARGVTGIYLQVEDGNLPARGLYRRAGFTSHHGYHYRIAPPGRGLPAGELTNRGNAGTLAACLPDGSRAARDAASCRALGTRS